MNENQQLFLAILFSNLTKYESVKQLYIQLVNELDYNKKDDFETVLNWFKDDKVNIEKRRNSFFTSILC